MTLYQPLEWSPRSVLNNWDHIPPQKNNQQTSVSLEKSLEANQPAKNIKKTVNKNIRKKSNNSNGKHPPFESIYISFKKNMVGFPAIAMLARKSSPSARAFGSCKTMPQRRPKNIRCRCDLWWWQNTQWIYSSPQKKGSKGWKEEVTFQWETWHNYEMVFVYYL